MAGTERVVRVLVVDDEADVRSLLRVVLEANGFQVVEASAGGAALAAARDHRPHVVVLDHDLHSAVTGLELAPLLKEQAPDCQVLLFSAVLSPDGLYASVDDALSKLTSITRIVAHVTALAAPAA